MPPNSKYPDALPSESLVLCTLNHKYRIDEVLGQGSFGITYLATCLQDFTPAYRHGEVIAKGTKLAIKECFPKKYAVRVGNAVEANDNAASAQKLYEHSVRFLQEGRTLAHFAAVSESASIVPIYHCGRIAHANITFFVMPYLDGGSLTSWACNLSPGQLADVLYQLLEALGYCHGQEEPLLHLDIKPDNIMMTHKNGRLIPVLIDFGLSQRQNGPETLRMDGVTVGYAPWEQADRKHWRDIAPWTDVYALGATMYSIITGEKPPSHKERPTILDYGNEDPYELLHTRPELVEAFSAVNPENGKRLLWSIDVALNPNMEDEGEVQGVSLPPRWLDANEWLEAAFPNGPWAPAASESDPDFEPDSELPDKAPHPPVSRKLIVALVIALLALLAALAYLLVFQPSRIGFNLDLGSDYSGHASAENEAEETAATAGEDTDSPEPEENGESPGSPSSNSALADSSDTRQAEPEEKLASTSVAVSEAPSGAASSAEEPTAPASVDVMEDGRLVMVNARNEEFMLIQWRNWANPDASGDPAFKAVFNKAENKAQVLLQFIYAWQNTSSYAKNQLGRVIHATILEPEFSTSDDLKAVKAFYQNCTGDSSWLNTLLSVQGSPSDDTGKRIVSSMSKLAQDEVKARLDALHYEWDGSKLICDEENRRHAAKLAAWGKAGWLAERWDDMTKATMLVALSLSTEQNEQTATLPLASEAPASLPNTLLMSCYLNSRSGKPWRDTFCTHFVRENVQTHARFDGLRRHLDKEYARQLLALLPEGNAIVSPETANLLKEAYAKLPDDEEKSQFLSQFVNKLGESSQNSFFLVDESTRKAMQIIRNCMAEEAKWQQKKKPTQDDKKAYKAMMKKWGDTIKELSSGINRWYNTQRTAYDTYIELLTSSPEAYRRMDENHRMQSLVLLGTNVIASNASKDSAAIRFINTVYGESPDECGKTLEALPVLCIKAHTCEKHEKTMRNLCYDKIEKLLNALPWDKSGYREWRDILGCLYNAI